MPSPGKSNFWWGKGKFPRKKFSFFACCVFTPAADSHISWQFLIFIFFSQGKCLQGISEDLRAYRSHLRILEDPQLLLALDELMKVRIPAPNSSKIREIGKKKKSQFLPQIFKYNRPGALDVPRDGLKVDKANFSLSLSMQSGNIWIFHLINDKIQYFKFHPQSINAIGRYFKFYLINDQLNIFNFTLTPFRVK